MLHHVRCKINTYRDSPCTPRLPLFVPPATRARSRPLEKCRRSSRGCPGWEDEPVAVRLALPSPALSGIALWRRRPRSRKPVFRRAAHRECTNRFHLRCPPNGFHGAREKINQGWIYGQTRACRRAAGKIVQGLDGHRRGHASVRSLSHVHGSPYINRISWSWQLGSITEAHQ